MYLYVLKKYEYDGKRTSFSIAIDRFVCDTGCISVNSVPFSGHYSIFLVNQLSKSSFLFITIWHSIYVVSVFILHDFGTPRTSGTMCNIGNRFLDFIGSKG